MSDGFPESVPDAVALLGEPRAVFRARAWHTALYILCGVGALVMGLALIALLVGLLFQARGHGGGTFHLVVFGISLLTAGVGMLVKAGKTRGLAVYVCPGGLAAVQGERVRTLRWDEITTVQRGTEGKRNEFSISHPARLCLKGASGQELEFNESLAGLSDLRQLVQQHTLDHLLAPVAETYLAGGTAHFGELGVSRNGIHHKKDLLPWDQLEAVAVDGAEVVVRATGRKRPVFRVPLARVPNAHVLTALAEHARQDG
jgi:hypothetical protein